MSQTDEGVERYTLSKPGDRVDTSLGTFVYHSYSDRKGPLIDLPETVLGGGSANPYFVTKSHDLKKRITGKAQGFSVLIEIGPN